MWGGGKCQLESYQGFYYSGKVLILKLQQYLSQFNSYSPQKLVTVLFRVQVGHNIYILCHQLAGHNKELAALVRACPAGHNAPALQYYRTHTAQIEVSSTCLHGV